MTHTGITDARSQIATQLELPENTDVPRSKLPNKGNNLIEEEKEEEDEDQQIRPEDLLMPDKPKKKLDRREVVAKPKGLMLARPLEIAEVQMTLKQWCENMVEEIV